MRQLLIAGMIVVACGPSARPVAPPTVGNAGSGSGGAMAACLDVAADIARRAPDATPVDADRLDDFDGDGVADPDYVVDCGSVGGNCDHHLYGSNHGCARYLGTVLATRVSSGPICWDPPSADGTPCKISASRMMIHGEIYQYFYDYGPDGYVEAGVGNEGPPPP